MKWDFFIAHAGPDTEFAEKLFEQLETQARVFLDSKRLLLGDNWDEALQEAQKESLVSVILVSSNTEKAYYQREEIAAAINMARDDQIDHRVVPVYLDAVAARSAPYGLRLKHGLMLAGAADLPRAADKLLRLLAQLQGGEIRVLDQASDMVMPECPYMGLAHFNEDDRDLFFGRESFSEKLYKAFSDKPLVAVVGPSGSGKSSVVRAGFMPKLRQEGFDQDGGAGSMVVMLPRDKPFHELATALLPLIEPGLGKLDRLRKSKELAQDFRAGNLELCEVVGLIHEGSQREQRPVLIIDQFEEVFTLAADPKTQARFLDLIINAVKDEGTGLKVILTLRADFWGQALSYRPLLDILEDADVKLGLMNREELSSAIEEPARLRGVRFEPGLTERILDDVGRDAGNLPLLEFALTQLWTLQDATLITHAAYDQIGGIKGALTSYADEIFNDLKPAEQESVRRVLVQMVKSGEGTQDTRRLARREDFVAADWQLARRLADMRLLVTGSDPETVEETAEVVHEALIQNWSRLRGWMESDRAFRTWQDRMRLSLDQWGKSGHKLSALLTGLPLQEAQKWRKERQDELSEVERVYIQKSIRKNYVLWGAGIFVVTAVIIGLSLLVTYASGQAKIANNQAQISDAQRLIAESQLTFKEKPLTGLQLAIEGLELLPADDVKLRDNLEQTYQDLAQQGKVSLLGTQIQNASLITDTWYILNGVTTTLRTSRDPENFITLGGEMLSVFPIPNSEYFVIDFLDQEDALYTLHNPEIPTPLEEDVFDVVPVPPGEKFLVVYDSGYGQLFNPNDIEHPITSDIAIEYFDTSLFVSIAGEDYFVIPDSTFSGSSDQTVSATNMSHSIPIDENVNDVIPIPGSDYFVVVYDEFSGIKSQILSTSDIDHPFTLDGEIAYSHGVTYIPDSDYFVVAYSLLSNVEGQLFSTSDINHPITLDGKVLEVVYIPGSDYFAVVYYDKYIQLFSVRDIDHPIILDGKVISTVNVIPIPGSDYFAVIYYDDYDKLFSTGDIEHPITLDGEVLAVFPIPGSEFFIVAYRRAESQLFNINDIEHPITLHGKVYSFNGLSVFENNHGQLGVSYFAVKFTDGKTKLWGSSIKPLLDMGIGVESMIRTSDDRLVVTYVDGRAYLLDLAWLSAMGGEADSMDINTLMDIVCEGPLSWGLVDQAILSEKLQGRLSLACQP